MINKYLVLMSFILMSCNILHGQSNTSWDLLSKISFEKKYDEILGFDIDKPVFSTEVKKIEGKEITIKGYIIPTEGYKSHKEFILSAYPYNMCYFCGGAGPETVLEVEAIEGIKFQAKPITIKGILHLNADDINSLIYKISNAKLIDRGS